MESRESEKQKRKEAGRAEKQRSRKSKKQRSKEAKKQKSRSRKAGKHRTRNPKNNPKPAAKKEIKINSSAALHLFGYCKYL